MKILSTVFFILVTLTAAAQDNSARAIGGHLGKFIAGFLIVFLLFRFVIKPMFKKK